MKGREIMSGGPDCYYLTDGSVMSKKNCPRDLGPGSIVDVEFLKTSVSGTRHVSFVRRTGLRTLHLPQVVDWKVGETECADEPGYRVQLLVPDDTLKPGETVEMEVLGQALLEDRAYLFVKRFISP
jgi:hypothetical protein